MRRLYLILPDPLPEQLTDVDWVSQDGESGHAALAALPAAEEVWLVLPAARVLLTHIALPTRVLKKLGDRLAHALEDKLLQDPETVHVALGPEGPLGRCAAVVERAWLAKALDCTKELNVRGALPASLLWQPPDGLQSGDWLLIWDGSGGQVRTDACQGFACDGGSATTPPPALVLAMQAARARGAPPARLLLDAAHAQPDLSAWAKALGCPIQVVSATVGVPVLNLLQGTFAPRYGLSRQLAPYRPAAMLVLAALVLHVIALAAHTAWLAWQVRTLEAQARSLFLSVFPHTRAIVDPALQLRRQLEAMRIERGYPVSDDLLAMIGALLDEVRTATALTYSPGRLELAGAVVPDMQSLEARLSLSPYTLETSPQADGRLHLVLSLPQDAHARHAPR